MNFSEQTDEFINPFLNSFGKCDKNKFSKIENNTFQSILISLYNDIHEANKTIFNAGCFKYTVLNKAAIKKPKDYSNKRYFPEIIQKYIKDNEQKQLLFSCGNVGNREINIHFTLFAESAEIDLERYIQHVRMMYMWLSICAKYATKYCTNTLDVYVYPTPFTKNLPESTTTTLGPENVNTAFTQACAPKGQLIIFREEEWFKVFIHETFHTYGLDFSQSDISSMKKELISLYPIESDFDIYEAYTETWARIINCALCSYNALENKRDRKIFFKNLDFCLELERMFALYQCVKVIGFMGLTYDDLHSPNSHALRKGLYRENTHVFSYYVLTAVFLNDYQGFILWCKEHNEVLLRFNSTPENFIAFTEYIKSVYNCIPLQNGIKYMSSLIKQHNNRKIKGTSISGSKGMSSLNQRALPFQTRESSLGGENQRTLMSSLGGETPFQTRVSSLGDTTRMSIIHTI